MNIRIGNGFDVHKLEHGNEITLCGIKIPHNKQLIGHSDADVALHALTDALLGALCKGDIGVYFPPSNQQWKDANSKIFLRKAISLMSSLKYSLVNMDITIICQEPKIINHSLAMRNNIASLCQITLDQVNIKGTTTEKLGFTGRDEGIAALATILISQDE